MGSKIEKGNSNINMNMCLNVYKMEPRHQSQLPSALSGLYMNYILFGSWIDFNVLCGEVVSLKLGVPSGLLKSYTMAFQGGLAGNFTS